MRSRRAVSRSPLGSRDVLGVQPVHERPHPLAVLREALVVAAVALEHALVGRAVDVVDRHGRAPAAPPVINASRSPSGASDRYVDRRRSRRSSGRARSSGSDAERLAQQLGVAHDRVGAEVREVLVRRVCRARPTGVERPVPRWSSSSTRKSFSARSSQPGPRGLPVGRGASKPGPALQVDEERLVAPVRVGDLAREDA